MSLPPKKFAWPPQNFSRDVRRSRSLSESPTQTIDSSPCCKTGPSSGPPQMKMSGSAPEQLHYQNAESHAYFCATGFNKGQRPKPRLPNPRHARLFEVARDAISPEADFSNFLVLFCTLKYICHQNTPKLCLLFLLWAYYPKTCITNVSKICQFFRFGLHPHKLAALCATIELIFTSCYSVKRIKIKGFVTSQ